MPSRTRTALATLALTLAPVAAWAQQPSGLLPGQEPELARPIPYWLSFPVAAAAVGLSLLIGFLYWRLSSRFYGREEEPTPRARPRFAGMAAAQPQAAAPQGAASARVGATAAAQAAGQAPTPPKPAAPPAATTPSVPAAAPEEAKPEPAAAQPPPAAGGHVEPDQETFDRTLKEQLDKGVDRRVAEGRARAAAIKAARQKAG